MGIHSRDYYREESNWTPSHFGASRQTNWAIKYLLIANIAVFLLQVMSQGTLTDWLSLKGTNIFPDFQLWRLVTYGFCHSESNIMHIGFNMLVLWMFGRVIEPIYGSKEFLSFYLCGVVISGLCHLGIQLGQDDPTGVIGASGGVMSVVFLTAMVYPRMTVLLMFVIPIQLRFLAIFYAAVDIWGTLNPEGSRVAHAAHLGGAAFGVAYKYFNWHIVSFIGEIKHRLSIFRRKRKNKMRIHRPKESKPVKNIDKEVDRILEKIHESGEDSLTESERKTLKDASKKYKNRTSS